MVHSFLSRKNFSATKWNSELNRLHFALSCDRPKLFVFSEEERNWLNSNHKLAHLSRKYFFEESHIKRMTYDKKRMHEAPDPYASATRRNK